MAWLAILAIIVIGAIVIASLMRQKPKDTSKDFPYEKLASIFTPAERSFLGVLSQSVSENVQVFGKVRVADVAKPKAGMSPSERQTAFNKISGKHFDFVLCDKADLSILSVVELNDKSHSSSGRQQRDAFLDGMCRAIGIPLIQVPAKTAYTIDEISQLLAPYLIQAVPSRHAENTIIEEAKVCPKCASSLIERIAKQGSHAGQSFWACSAYPKCKYIEEASV